MDRIVFFLNGERGMACLEALLSEHEVALVVIPECKHDGDLHHRVGAMGLDVLPTTDVNADGFIEKLRELGPTLSIIGGYSQIFKEPLISLPTLGTINLHGGRLPEYRGGSPLNWQIINGETELGISIIRIDEGIDTGSVLASDTFTLDADETIADAHAHANALFQKLLAGVIDDLDRGTSAPQEQDATHARYWHQRGPADGEIRWREMSARQVHDLVRALTHPYPGAFTASPAGKIKIFSTRVIPDAVGGVPGRVFRLRQYGPAVVCRDGAIEILEFSSANSTQSLKPGWILGSQA